MEVSVLDKIQDELKPFLTEKGLNHCMKSIATILKEARPEDHATPENDSRGMENVIRACLAKGYNNALADFSKQLGIESPKHPSNP